MLTSLLDDPFFISLLVDGASATSVAMWWAGEEVKYAKQPRTSGEFTRLFVEDRIRLSMSRASFEVKSSAWAFQGPNEPSIFQIFKMQRQLIFLEYLIGCSSVFQSTF